VHMAEHSIVSRTPINVVRLYNFVYDNDCLALFLLISHYDHVKFCPCFLAHEVSSLAYPNFLGTKRLGGCCCCVTLCRMVLCFISFFSVLTF
jgi:hypothetical protein